MVDRAVEREAEAVTKEVTREREVGVVKVEEEEVVSRLVVVAGKRDEVEVEMMVVVVSSVDDSLVELVVEVVVVSSSSSAVVVVLLDGGVLVVDGSSSSSVLEVVGVGLSLMVDEVLDVAWDTRERGVSVCGRKQPDNRTHSVLACSASDWASSGQRCL